MVLMYSMKKIKLISADIADPTSLLEKAMERTKRVRSHFRVQYIPLEEMFTSQELMDLRGAFDSVSMG